MVSVDDLTRAAGDIAGQFQLDVRIIDNPLDPRPAYDAARRQYNSGLLLRDLASTSPPEGDRLLGITDLDIFIPMLSFVFGQAQLSGRTALVSFARLRQEFYGLPPGRTAFEHRARKEIAHELGHTFGLIHCANRACPMSLSTGIAQVDAKGDRFCDACAAILRDSGVPIPKGHL